MKHELTQEEILVEIKDILSEYVEITRPLTPADRLIDDLGLDSFLIVYFITEIEDCFEIDIPETDFIELVTVKDLCERIQLEIKKHSTYYAAVSFSVISVMATICATASCFWASLKESLSMML